jgi:hypothetical protein
VTWRPRREDIAWIVGIVLILWDILYFTPGEVSQGALVVYGGLLGLPLVLRADKKLNGK